MKKLLAVIGVTALLVTVAQAQFVSGRTEPPATKAAGDPWYADLIGFLQGADGARQVTVAVYPSYAPGLKNAAGEKTEWGAGLALGYPVGTSHIIALGRVDWLADAMWAPSVTITPNMDLQLLGHNFTAFAIGGAVVPAGGTGEDGEIGAVFGCGIYTTVWQPSPTASLQMFGAWERWTPVLDVDILHVGLAFTYSF